eukprot:6204953-Pleurochrysis_carterae.AAC.4
MAMPASRCATQMLLPLTIPTTGIFESDSGVWADGTRRTSEAGGCLAQGSEGLHRVHPTRRPSGEGERRLSTTEA